MNRAVTKPGAVQGPLTRLVVSVATFSLISVCFGCPIGCLPERPSSNPDMQELIRPPVCEPARALGWRALCVASTGTSVAPRRMVGH
jgi:hypothetical protein